MTRGVPKSTPLAIEQAARLIGKQRINIRSPVSFVGRLTMTSLAFFPLIAFFAFIVILSLLMLGDSLRVGLPGTMFDAMDCSVHKEIEKR
ncbi:MAG: hypothetical protein IJT12_04955 [Paludibacteraceae bacterium]|nr:hypothetical protein [Paludibacteraceae bacterium]